MVERIGTLIWLVTAAWAILRLLQQKREPSATLAWLLFVTLVPFVGAFAFLIFGPQKLERNAVKRRKGLEKMLSLTGGPRSQDPEPYEPQRILPRGEGEVLTLAQKISEYGATTGNRIGLLPDPQEALEAMQAAIESARSFIHLEYYIIANDEVTKQLFDCLEAAARRGVEVRILYDSLGSLSLKRMYFRPLIQQGVKVAGFLPLLTFVPQRLNVNFRNHRKILVVDGLVAFTGGTNIGKEYLGRRNKNQWRDHTARVEGPVCGQLEDVFAKDWHFTTKEDLFLPKYYPPTDRPGDSIVQVLESGPDSPFYSLHQALFLAINSAQEEILLTTPYFVPDPAILSSLCVAALRGVKVEILLPSKSDNWLVQFASRSFYEELLQAGVRLYEYQPRILHAKLLSIDGKWTILGSANMDTRSFHLNFELNLMVHGPSVATQASRLFRMDMRDSLPVELAPFRQRGPLQRYVENACRILSPVL